MSTTFITVVLILAMIGKTYTQPLYLDKIILPPDFKIELYATNTPNARSLAIGEHGTVFAGSLNAGNVYALTDTNNDNKADKTGIIYRGKYPNGVAFYKGSLYIAEISRIIRLDSIESHLDNPLSPVIIRNDYPDNFHHGWKFIRFSPDNYLYVPIGAPCNVCKSKDPRFGTITRIKPNGSDFEIYARGIRNSVGFDWSPKGSLWFTDNGRDRMGDNLPPDELNYAPHAGMDFGFPYCFGDTVSDPQYGKDYPCNKFTPPALNLPAHVAPLGMRFYHGSMFPDSFQNSIFIAEHGSWNRSSKIGYRVSMVTLHDTIPVSYSIFAQGWLQEQTAWGRPVDIEIMKDGSLLVSDDLAGAIYRIYYNANQPDLRSEKSGSLHKYQPKR